MRSWHELYLFILLATLQNRLLNDWFHNIYFYKILFSNAMMDKGNAIIFLNRISMNRIFLNFSNINILNQIYEE